MDGWTTNFFLGPGIFSPELYGFVSFRGYVIIDANFQQDIIQVYIKNKKSQSSRDNWVYP